MPGKKVSIIGAGNVGATAAYYIAEKVIADIVMVDVAERVTRAKAIDFLHAGPMRGYDVSIEGTGDYAAIAGSDLVVVTAGVARKPGMDRMDLLRVNAGIVKAASKMIARYAPNATVIVVSNPLDVMCHVVYRTTGFAVQRVIGMAGILDATRFRYFVAERLGCALADVHAMVLGGHGDQMVPLPRFTTVAGIPVTRFLDAETLELLVDRTRKGGGGDRGPSQDRLRLLRPRGVGGGDGGGDPHRPQDPGPVRRLPARGIRHLRPVHRGPGDPGEKRGGTHRRTRPGAARTRAAP